MRLKLVCTSAESAFCSICGEMPRPWSQTPAWWPCWDGSCPSPWRWPPRCAVLPPRENSTAADLTFVSVVSMASAAGKPSVERPETSASMPAAMGGNVQPLADDAGGGHHHVLGGDTQRVRGEGAHLLRHFLAVGVAGVGVAAVAKDGGGVAVGDVGLRDQERRALDEVLRVHRGGGGALLGDDERQIALVAVLRMPQWMPLAVSPARRRRRLR